MHAHACATRQATRGSALALSASASPWGCFLYGVLGHGRALGLYFYLMVWAWASPWGPLLRNVLSMGEPWGHDFYSMVWPVGQLWDRPFTRGFGPLASRGTDIYHDGLGRRCPRTSMRGHVFGTWGGLCGHSKQLTRRRVGPRARRPPGATRRMTLDPHHPTHHPSQTI